MEYSKENINNLTKKIYNSRLRLLTNHPFFGVLVLDLLFALDDKIRTFSTDGKTIYFNPNYLSKLSDYELDFCLLHEIMHIILKHPFKKSNYSDKNIYHAACDIVVNSNIINSLSPFFSNLTIQGHIIPHTSPDGKEGYLCSVQEIYDLLIKKQRKKDKKINKNKSIDDGFQNDDNDDNSKSQTTPMQAYTVPIFKFASTYTGDIYLKSGTSKDYHRNYGFSKNEEITKDKTNQTIINYLKFINEKRHSIFYEFLNPDFKEKLTPSYLLDSQLNNYNSDSGEGLFEFIYQPLKYDMLINLNNYKNKNILDDSIYKKYLDVPYELKIYFSNIIKKYNINISDPDIIFKIRTFIKECAKYDVTNLSYSSPKDKDFILYFMEESKRGVCYHFATAATMFYRYIGIPSRLAVGYHIDSVAKTECIAYKEQSHAWTEIYLENIGWVIIDPTPSLTGENSSSSNEDSDDSFDDDNKWNTLDDEEQRFRENEIDQKVLEANEIHSSSKTQGNLPNHIKLMIKKLTTPQLDWRVYLNNFIQENIVDYSFCPPDTRFSDTDFILPSFSETDEEVKNILFMIDCSGSMSDKDIALCFSELQGAIEQFNGKISGHVGFFDSHIQNVSPFDGDTDVLNLKPAGRGGTSFMCIFEYLKSLPEEEYPVSLIILTDGYASFPKKDIIDIPVLWIINNDSVTPPWGNVTRILKS